MSQDGIYDSDLFSTFAELFIFTYSYILVLVHLQMVVRLLNLPFLMLVFTFKILSGNWSILVMGREGVAVPCNLL